MSTYAVVESGAKQYRVQPQSIIEVEKIFAAEDTTKDVILDRVLLVSHEDQIKVGSPVVQGAQVVCENLGEIKAPKVVSFFYRRRKASQRKQGHRQQHIRLRVKEIKF